KEKIQVSYSCIIKFVLSRSSFKSEQLNSHLIAVHLAVYVAVQIYLQIFVGKDKLQDEPQHGLQVGVSVVRI
ncbi:MAG: hypothetical protein KBF99_18515, partial [Leptospiraceae bacterium]|nr:hypothetical protein [Leptospiraceae bacterium]